MDENLTIKQTLAALKTAFTLFVIAWYLLCICFRRTSLSG